MADPRPRRTNHGSAGLMSKSTAPLARRLPDLRWGLLPILLVPVIVSFWPRSEQFRPSESAPATAPESIDYYLRGAKMSALDDNGQLLYQIRADEVLHYPDESANMSGLAMDYLGPEGDWQLTAPVGRAPTGGKEVQLSGGVRITGGRRGQPSATVTMDEARLLPDRKQLDTDSPVAMDEPGRKVRAVGMTMDFRTDRVKLKHKVRVNHAP